MDQREPDARFTFANERTFLAWARTCMAMVATGLVLARLIGDDDALAVVSGVALIVLGAVLAHWSFRNYRRNDEAIRAQTPLARSALPLVLLVTIGIASVVAVALSLS